MLDFRFQILDWHKIQNRFAFLLSLSPVYNLLWLF